MKYHHILPALIFSMLYSALSCQQKEIVHEEDISLKNSIQFQASEYEAILSRSGNGNLATKKTFLGMAGKDSLFILATVSENNTYDQVQTKAGESTPVLGSFHIKAYKDGANSPYVDEKLTSEDGWNTYSPTLYWPNTYDHIDFFAYSYDVGENLALTNFRITDGHIADFDYVTPSSVQPDLSFAIAPDQTEEDAPINLDFFHTLAAVRFVTGDIGEVSNPAANVKISNKSYRIKSYTCRKLKLSIGNSHALFSSIALPLVNSIGAIASYKITSAYPRMSIIPFPYLFFTPLLIHDVYLQSF